MAVVAVLPPAMTAVPAPVVQVRVELSCSHGGPTLPKQDSRASKSYSSHPVPSQRCPKIEELTLNDSVPPWSPFRCPFGKTINLGIWSHAGIGPARRQNHHRLRLPGSGQEWRNWRGRAKDHTDAQACTAPWHGQSIALGFAGDAITFLSLVIFPIVVAPLSTQMISMARCYVSITTHVRLRSHTIVWTRSSKQAF
jgi:hypothetical protein